MTAPLAGELPASLRGGEVTRDALLAGRVILLQPARGYRVNIDALLLAAFAAEGRRPSRVVDLGAGVGAVSLVFAALSGGARFDLVEPYGELAALARANLALAGLEGEVHELTLGPGARLDRLVGAELVVSNPPFFDAGTTRPARDPRVRAAREGALAPFVGAARRLLTSPRSRAVFAYPARSSAAVFESAAREGLVVKRLRLVHSDRESPARLALVELRWARPGGLVIEPPLYEWSAPGVRSAELAALTGDRAADRA